MSEVQEIELSIEHANKLVANKDMALKLSSNREFKKLITEGYFEKEAARLTALLTDPNVSQYKDDIITSLEGISSLQLYMRTIVQIGQAAENEIAESRTMLDDLLEEGNH